MKTQTGQLEYRGRRLLMLALLLTGALVLVWRAVDLQVVRKDFLQGQGDGKSVV